MIILKMIKNKKINTTRPMSINTDINCPRNSGKHLFNDSMKHFLMIIFISLPHDICLVASQVVSVNKMSAPFQDSLIPT